MACIAILARAHAQSDSVHLNVGSHTDGGLFKRSESWTSIIHTQDFKSVPPNQTSVVKDITQLIHLSMSRVEIVQSL